MVSVPLPRHRAAAPAEAPDADLTAPADSRVQHSQEAVRRVREVLLGLAAAGPLVTLPRGTDAATHLGVSPERVVGSTLLLPATGDPRLVLTPQRVDADRLADLLELPMLVPATDDQARRHTGFPADAIAPVGHPTPVRVVIDVRLSRHRHVWVPAGHPRVLLRTHYEELLRITAGEPAGIG